MTEGIKKIDKQEESSWIKDCVTFVALTSIVYLCYVTSGVYHQKILKHQYLNPQTGQKSYFQQAIVFTLFPQFCAAIIGYIYKLIDKLAKQNKQNNNNKKKPIPWTKFFVCGLVVNFNMYTYNQAVVQASFPAVVMVKSCSLLSVILVGVFCSRVKDKGLKLKSNKIVIGVLACVGIFIFNFFKDSQKSIVDKPITLMSSLLLIASLIGDGFLPDLQAEIKSEYKPDVMEMYLQTNKSTCCIAFIFVIVTGKLFYFINFLTSHDEIVTDIAALSILNAVGQIVIYKMIKMYKQHIPAFVIGIRKCLTVVVNILYFGHSINMMQLSAISFVFCSIMWQTYDNYKQKKQKQLKELKKREQSQNLIQANLQVKETLNSPQTSSNSSGNQNQIETGQQASLKNNQT